MSFSNKFLKVVFHWRLSDNKSPRMFWTLLSILSDFNNFSALEDLDSSLISIPAVSFPNPCGSFQTHQLLLISLSPSCSTAFLILLQNPGICLCFRFLLFSLFRPLEHHNPFNDKSFFSYLLILGLDFWPVLNDLIVSQSPREFYLYHFLGRIAVCTYINIKVNKEGDQKAPFSLATTPRCKGGCYSFRWIAPLYPWYDLILLSVKQGGIKYISIYHFLILSNFNFLHNYEEMTFPTRSWLV